MIPTEQGQYLEVVCTATCQCPIEYLWQHPRQGPSVYEVPPAGAHKLGVGEGGIRESTKVVCRNLVQSMPRRMEAVIQAKECQTKCKQKKLGHYFCLIVKYILNDMLRLKF